MNAQEQAYINGFVKRAAEYGFDENQAIAMLKEAARGTEAGALFIRHMAPAAAHSKKGFKNLANKIIKNDKKLVPARHSPDAKELADSIKQLRKTK